MITRAEIEIGAPAERVWEVFTDVERWPSWTPSVTSVEPLDAPSISVGNRFRIKQPKLPTLVWQVTAVDAPHSWTWAVRSIGATTSATHDVTPAGPSACVVAQVIDQSGVLGSLAGALTRRLTRKYWSLEGNGLKTVSELREPHAAQP
jgi:uncharacterized protein YndB with AHSA1/START domain